MPTTANGSATATAAQPKTFIEAITEALHEEMASDERVFCIGEDIGLYGGVFKATKGLQEAFGAERVIDSPLSESMIVGAGVGAALVGMRPVPEIQFADFITCGIDQIVEQASRIRYRTGGSWTCPVVIRCPYGGDVSGGLYHSQSVEAWFVHTPGIKVLVPAFPSDAKGMLKAAIRDPDPVLFFEHKKLYRSVKEVLPEGDYTVELGPAKVRRLGTHVTAFSYGLMLHRTLEAAGRLAQEGIEVEVVDLRCLQPLDRETICRAAKKTGRVVIVHEDQKTLGVGAEIAATITESVFESLDAPIFRVTAPDVPAIPFAPTMEHEFLPNIERIAHTLRQAAAY
jgi:2-oxoisovalerate dehydrogenase E1 component beta subunit